VTFLLLSDFSETVDRKNISSYNERMREVKTAISYVEQPERLLKSKASSRSTDNDGVLKEIKQLNNSKYNSELRKELFDGDDSSGLRRRGANESSETMEKYYSNIQEKLSDEMLTLTRNLKEQTLTASKIIKKDTDVVTKSARIAHQNTGSLEKESKKLDEHNKRACKCWMWMMIAIVIAIFIGEFFYDQQVTE
jgi:SNARE protein 1